MTIISLSYKQILISSFVHQSGYNWSQQQEHLTENLLLLLFLVVLDQ